jgi:hypothetical protein
MSTIQNRGIIKLSLDLIWKILALPEDYRMCGTYADPLRNTICVIVENPHLPATEEGQRLPQLYPVYKSRDFEPMHELENIQIEDYDYSAGGNQ